MKYVAYSRINGGEWDEVEVTNEDDYLITADNAEDALDTYIESIKDNLCAVDAKKVDDGKYTYKDDFGDDVTLEVEMREVHDYDEDDASETEIR